MSDQAESVRLTDLLGAEKEGIEAAKSSVVFSDSPYLFCKFHGMKFQEWDEKIRPLMNAWFRGWKNWLNENGLQYDFKPRRVRT